MSHELQVFLKLENTADLTFKLESVHKFYFNHKSKIDVDNYYYKWVFSDGCVFSAIFINIEAAG